VNTWAFYALWILGPILIGLATRQPAMLAAVVLALVLSRWLPDPAVWLRSMRRKRTLEAAISLNPHNTTARRDLALILLDRKRPARALAVLRDARDPTPEIDFLLGCALLESGDAAAALPELDKSIARDPKLRYGDPHLMMGRAHQALGQLDLADTSLARFVAVNGSSVEGYVRLARVRKARGDTAGAAAATREARTTYRQLPAFHKRKQRGWYVRALLA
jgi:predicted Zn-dependent protease